jgi:hypothetical protein
VSLGLEPFEEVVQDVAAGIVDAAVEVGKGAVESNRDKGEGIQQRIRHFRCPDVLLELREVRYVCVSGARASVTGDGNGAVVG